MDDAIRTKKYRRWAAEIRIIAQDVRGDDRRRFLMKVAKDLEQLALDIETAEVAAPPAAESAGLS